MASDDEAIEGGNRNIKYVPVCFKIIKTNNNKTICPVISALFLLYDL